MNTSALHPLSLTVTNQHLPLPSSGRIPLIRPDTLMGPQFRLKSSETRFRFRIFSQSQAYEYIGFIVVSLSFFFLLYQVFYRVNTVQKYFASTLKGRKPFYDSDFSDVIVTIPLVESCSVGRFFRIERPKDIQLFFPMVNDFSKVCHFLFLLLLTSYIDIIQAILKLAILYKRFFLDFFV